jgi:hypothetical protein
MMCSTRVRPFRSALYIKNKVRLDLSVHFSAKSRQLKRMKENVQQNNATVVLGFLGVSAFGSVLQHSLTRT